MLRMDNQKQMSGNNLGYAQQEDQYQNEDDIWNLRQFRFKNTASI